MVLIMNGTLVVPALASFGVIHSAAALSTLAVLGGIVAAFLTMNAEINRQNGIGDKKT
jgi:uncharacterized membrane protein